MKRKSGECVKDGHGPVLRSRRSSKQPQNRVAKKATTRGEVY